MKKVLSLFLSLIFAFSTLNAYAQDIKQYDYEEELSVLHGLIADCENKGIFVDYEKINYNVIKQFETHMNDDYAVSVDSDDATSVPDRLTFNDAKITELYNNTKADLEAYLAGEKKPIFIQKPNMNGLQIDGNYFVDGENPVISLGYNRTKEADVFYNFNDIGVNQVQTEIRPNEIKEDYHAWNQFKYGTPTVSVSQDTANYNEGSNSLHVIHTDMGTETRWAIRQDFGCEPDTSYEFGFSYYTESALPNFWCSLNWDSGRKGIQAGEGWQTVGFTHTSGSSDTKLEFALVSDKSCDIYLDNCYVYKIDASGNRTGNNLLENSGFEEGIDIYTSIKYVVDLLKYAQKMNTGVSVLLSPHYFPTNLTDTTTTLYNNNAAGFLKYNINAPAAKTYIEDYLRKVLPYLSGYKSLNNICLTNEPQFKTTDYPEFYNPEFRKYLEKKHKTIVALNTAYGGTEYSNFDEISMPVFAEKNGSFEALCYDWMEFNDRVLADWHIWMAGIVKEYLPNVPVGSKMMEYFIAATEPSDRFYLSRGTDLELFAEFSDYAGNDAWNYDGHYSGHAISSFLYDYQYSVTKTPVFNMETHLIEDKAEKYIDQTRVHWENAIWQGVAHGLSKLNLWSWHRTYDNTSVHYTSAATRPDVIAATGKTTLDLTRLSNEIVKLQQKKPAVAIWYSKPSRLYDSAYMTRHFNAYRALLSIGQKPGVVTDKSVNLLSDYDVLVIPGAEYCTAEALAAVKAFKGKIIYCGNPFTKDEYKKSLNNSGLTTGAHQYSDTVYTAIADDFNTYLKGLGIQRIEIKDGAGKIATGIDWSYYLADGGFLINVSNIATEGEKYLSVYLDDVRVTSMEELVSGTTVGDTFTLGAYGHMLLRYRTGAGAELDRICYDADLKRISWSYSDEFADTANIYKVNDDGHLSLFQTIRGRNYTFLGSEDTSSYIVRTKWGAQEEKEGRMISVSGGKPFGLNVKSCSADNGTIVCEIDIKNTTSTYLLGTLYLKVLNDEGDVLKYVKYTPVVKGGQTLETSFSMPLNGNLDKLVAVILDNDVSKHSLSQTIEKQL